MSDGASDHPEGLEHERLGDRHVRALIDRYVAHAGASLTELSPHLYEMTVPIADRRTFADRTKVRLAFSLEAVQADADAEMAIVGSAFVEQLIAAIRGRGARYFAGSMGALQADATTKPSLPASVKRGQAAEADSSIAIHRVGRLTARVVIRAGATLEEHLVESQVYDTVSGVALGADITAECEQQLASELPRAAIEGVPVATAMPASDLVSRMLGDLELALAPQIERLRQKAEQDFTHESGRIHRYYQSMLEDSGGRGTAIPDRDARRVFEAERDRRLSEERDRHDVRATVHPVQLTEWQVLVQRAHWALTSNGHRGEATAERVLAGDRHWHFGCPNCGATAPTEISVCRHDHVTCSTCDSQCSVCDDSFCDKHGIAACHVDSRPACDAHARTCVSCLRSHCSAHQGECADGGHAACTSCLGSCATCGDLICDSHASHSAADAPRGARRFCARCVRRCEGGSNELVGPDEVTGCATCERVVCEDHQARCEVDGHVHCSTHLRRTDRSRRLVCVKDRTVCSYEPTAVFAVDEISPCSSCGAMACAEHLGTCAEDLAVHCDRHLSTLGDRRGEKACETHRTTCHVDGAAFSLTGTHRCPVCERRSCDRHRFECASCGRHVCSSDRAAPQKVCVTCADLRPRSVPADEWLTPANELFEDAMRAKSWRSARDATHSIVEADLGWTRKVVFVLRHGSDRAERASMKSVLGSKRLL